MIDFEADNTEINAKILLEGMFYSELPPVLDDSVMKENIIEVLKKMDDEEYTYFRFQNDLIKDFKDIVSPDYIRGNGVETITYYAFKKNATLREMQIPHLLHYCSFIYNTLAVFDDIFTPLYLEPDNGNYVKNSNSYVVIGDRFIVSSGYDAWQELEEGVFTTDNNKIQNNAMFGENRRRYHEQQGAYLYAVKMDIESFFPNMYTHYFEKIAEYQPYKQLGFEKEYFVFLDNFHQKINNNQTKGIPAGVFSSHIAAELCMLCVDYLIREEIDGQEIGYIRYVDDMTFFSDSKQKLEQMEIALQRILNQFRLRVNGNKTTYYTNVRTLDNAADIHAVRERLKFLKQDVSCELTENDFRCFKSYLCELLECGNAAQMKTILSIFLRRLTEGKITLSEDAYSWFCYIYLLAFDNQNLVCHVYKILDQILTQVPDKSAYLAVLNQKTGYLNERYQDTLFQIWHYYVLVRHLRQGERAACMQEYFNLGGANPIVVCWFVKDGNGQNRDLIKQIKKVFTAEAGEQNWKQQIMFSRWWLPLFKIKMVDGFNYDSFMNGTSFPEPLTDLAAG